ncbi:MAG: helix-turn-helix domain-containing protein [Ruminococcus sp.]
MMSEFPRIRNLREDADWTQAQVAEVLHVSQRTYAYYESGQRTIPPQILIALANLHHTSVDYLLGLTTERQPYPHENK